MKTGKDIVNNCKRYRLTDDGLANAIDTAIREAMKEQRHKCAEAVQALEENADGSYGHVSKDRAHQAVMNAEVK